MLGRDRKRMKNGLLTWSMLFVLFLYSVPLEMVVSSVALSVVWKQNHRNALTWCYSAFQIKKLKIQYITYVIGDLFHGSCVCVISKKRREIKPKLQNSVSLQHHNGFIPPYWSSQQNKWIDFQQRFLYYCHFGGLRRHYVERDLTLQCHCPPEKQNERNEHLSLWNSQTCCEKKDCQKLVSSTWSDPFTFINGI